MFDRDTNFIKTMNYIVTSDYDQSYLQPEKMKKINFFKWVYLSAILCAIFMSFIPLLAGESVTGNRELLMTINIVMFSVFTIDYCLRWITYRYRASKHSKYPLLFFPFTGVSIIMIFGLLPSFVILFSPLFEETETNPLENFIQILSSLVILQLGRLILLLNVVPPFRLFTNIFIKQRKILIYVFLFLILVTLLFAVVIYRAELDKNPNITSYWDAFYFTVISICTIGYGDILPVTDLGRIMVIVLAFVGVGIFTIPGAVIAGGFLEEIQEKRKREEEKEELEEAADKKKNVSVVEKTFLKSIDGVKKASEKVKPPSKDTENKKNSKKSKKKEKKKK
ncbi:MAG: potassium channel family protein [Metamycoplasmataceae bacterium]